MDDTLVFELTADGEQLEIHADEQGLRRLRAHIDSLLAGREHVHLMTPSWGGNELTEDLQSGQHKLLNHVKVFCWRGSK